MSRRLSIRYLLKTTFNILRYIRSIKSLKQSPVIKYCHIRVTAILKIRKLTGAQDKIPVLVAPRVKQMTKKN